MSFVWYQLTRLRRGNSPVTSRVTKKRRSISRKGKMRAGFSKPSPCSSQQFTLPMVCRVAYDPPDSRLSTVSNWGGQGNEKEGFRESVSANLVRYVVWVGSLPDRPLQATDSRQTQRSMAAVVGQKKPKVPLTAQAAH